MIWQDSRGLREPRVYAIADVQSLGSARASAAVVAMAESGIRWIQLRAKKTSGAEFYRLLEACCRSLRGSQVSLWVDDRVDLAALLPVSGVHLGQQDLSPADARRVLGDGPAIGQSTHNLAEVKRAAADPHVEVIAVGPIFPTTHKKNPGLAVGLDLLRKARELTDKPLVAIGGLSLETAAPVMELGASPAFLGAVCRGDVGRNCRQLLRAAKGGP